MKYTSKILRDIDRLIKTAAREERARKTSVFKKLAKSDDSDSFFKKVYRTAKDFAVRFKIPLSVAAGGIIGTLVGTKYGPKIKEQFEKIKNLFAKKGS
ncbi:MAG: hypothetical protein QXQ37_06955 [Nitrososphaerota archaeon]